MVKTLLTNSSHCVIIPLSRGRMANGGTFVIQTHGLQGIAGSLDKDRPALEVSI